jgi:hypothetical protein
MKLIAAKSLKYATRRLQAGDEFEARGQRDARVLVGARLARYAPEAAPEPPKTAVVMPTEVVEAPEDEGAKIVNRLRAEAERLGIAVDGRWGAGRLQQEIAQAKR